jgi:class 3 adenylate cyclase/tetratricopeptide (TPR) repeat protein
MEVADWLRQIGLERYAELFAQHGILADVLPHLTAGDLKDAGVASVGDRRRLLVAIKALGATQANAAAPLGITELGASAERRQITALFCDIVDSTLLTTQLDPEEWRELLSRYQLNVNAAVAATGGYIARVVGDAVLAYFGWPNADEAHAESAVRAGLAIIDTVDTHLSVRIGIASGLVVIGDLMGAGAVQEPMAVGETLHRAARLQSLAQPNTILVNEATHDQVRLLFEMEDLGPVTLKGFSTAQQVWRVERPTILSGRSEALFAIAPTPIVGRTKELDLLLEQWQRTLTGDGRVVLISGEPGIGKSRLLAALEERLVDQRHLSLRYFCSPYHQDDALHPIISRWERELGFGRNDAADDKLRKLEALVASRGLAPDGLPLLAAMLSIPLGDRYPSLDLSAQRRKEKTFDVLIGRLADLAKIRPVLALFEDAHWADPTTLELIGAGIDRLADLPVFRLVSFRPEFAPPWISRPNVTVLTLGRLDRQNAELLARQVAAQRALPPSLCERVIQQTDGVPLFIEEMTKAVLEETQSDPTSVDAIVVPKTLQGSLMARLDRLPIAKEVAQISAVIGRNFSFALLAAISTLQRRLLVQGLQELVASGLAFQLGTGIDALYAFKHALVRDVAYESLPRNRRVEIHAAIIRVAETDSSVGTIPPSRLGYHCAQAGLIAKAASYYRAAGERSAERAGLAETRNHLERGLQFARSLPEEPNQQVLEAELLIALGRLLIAIKGQSDPDACDVFERAVAVCRRLEQPDLLARALFARGAIAMSRSEISPVEIISAELLQLADITADPAIRIAAEVRLGILRFHQGQLVAAKVSLTRALELCRRDSAAIPDLAITSSPDVAAAAYLANTLAHLGHPERAIAHAQFAIERARSVGVASLAYAMALSTSARAYQTIGDEAGCHDCTQTLLATANENGFPQYLALGECLLGWLTARRGNVADGLRTMSQARHTLETLGWRREAAYVNVLLADVLTWAGQWQEATHLLDETLRTSARSGVAAFDASLHVRRAIVLQSSGDIAEAEHVFTQAAAVARAQSAKTLELQACNGLARLMLQQGRTAEARQILAPVYAWFSEGLDRADLQNASDILRRCAGR